MFDIMGRERDVQMRRRVGALLAPLVVGVWLASAGIGAVVVAVAWAMP